MPTLSSYKIVGFDEDRPPKTESFPCIYLHFALDQQAPPDWCEELVKVVGKSKYPVKMDPEGGLFIDTWVREPEEIAAVLESLKLKVAECNSAYDEKVNAPIVQVSSSGEEVKLSPEQVHLNQIVGQLTFE